MSKFSLTPTEIQRFENGEFKIATDMLSVEEPLLIRLVSGDGNLDPVDLSVTMRTPGNDKDLAIGFLFTEGTIRDKNDIVQVFELDGEVRLQIRNFDQLDLKKLERHFYTTSSCGVCGKASIDAVKLACPIVVPSKNWTISHEILRSLPEKLRKSQNSFDFSGGIHASGLFDLQGNLIDLSEDVGRHNALDKLIGRAFQRGMVPLFNSVLLLSGRASFELVQKASMAGVRMICAIGAPSSLAVELAEEYHITLVGFLRENRFNIYTSVERVG
jgi:FdhD protein